MIIASSLTHKGLIRPSNEDSFISIPEVGLFAVADGMGGHAAGEVASAIAIESVKSGLTPLLEKSGADKSQIKKAMLEVIKGANQLIIKKGEEEPSHKGMGTTLTLLILLPDQNVFLFGHVGDSRLYILRESELRQLSQDHTYVAELESKGYLTHEEATYHPFKHALTRALGISTVIDVDFGEGLLKPFDLFLLCTDGLTNEVQDDLIAKIMQAHTAEPDMCVQKLVGLALTAGGRDNITAIVVSFQP